MPLSRPALTGDTLTELARVARLDLGAGRAEIAGTALTLVYGLLDSLDALDLSDVPPATAFDARWE